MQKNESIYFFKKVRKGKSVILSALTVVLLLTTCTLFKTTEKRTNILDYKKIEIYYTTGDEYPCQKEMIFDRIGEDIYGMLVGVEEKVNGTLIKPEKVLLGEDDTGIATKS